MKRTLLQLLALVVLGVPVGARAGELRIYAFDVGEGEATLIVSPTGKAALLDAGPAEAAPRLRARLEALLTAPLEVAILSHDHLDHFGGLAQALSLKGAAQLVVSGFPQPSQSQVELMRAVAAAKIPVVEAKPGLRFDLGGGAVLTVLAPSRPFLTGTASDVHANSVVARLTYGERSFLFMGDGAGDAEKALLARGVNVKADVLWVGHHGDRTAASAAFLQAVKPSAAVISVGAGNGLGLPNRAPEDRLTAIQARVLRTDLDGELRIDTDGRAVRFSRGRP